MTECSICGLRMLFEDREYRDGQVVYCRDGHVATVSMCRETEPYVGEAEEDSDRRDWCWCPSWGDERARGPFPTPGAALDDACESFDDDCTILLGRCQELADLTAEEVERLECDTTAWTFVMVDEAEVWITVEDD